MKFKKPVFIFVGVASLVIVGYVIYEIYDFCSETDSKDADSKSNFETCQRHGDNSESSEDEEDFLPSPVDKNIQDAKSEQIENSKSPEMNTEWQRMQRLYKFFDPLNPSDPNTQSTNNFEISYSLTVMEDTIIEIKKLPFQSLILKKYMTDPKSNNFPFTTSIGLKFQFSQISEVSAQSEIQCYAEGFFRDFSKYCSDDIIGYDVVSFLCDLMEIYRKITRKLEKHYNAKKIYLQKTEIGVVFKIPNQHNKTHTLTFKDFTTFNETHP